MATRAASAPLQNIYYERKVATARPCYICKRETTTVLATIRTEDFLYSCDGHLADPASLISAPPSSPPGPSADDIKKVITDYEARQAKKAEKAKEGDGDKDKDKDKDKDVTKDTPKSPASPSPSPSIPTASPGQTHKKYALHRQIFEMRKAEIRRKELGAKAKEVGKGLPQVPRGNF